MRQQIVKLKVTIACRRNQPDPQNNNIVSATHGFRKLLMTQNHIDPNTEAENGSAADIFVDPVKSQKALDEVSLIESLPTQGRREYRRSTRYNVSWRVIIDLEGHSSYEGKIKDISLHGAAVLNELNLRPNTPITLHIQIPPLVKQGKPRVIQVAGKISYTVHDVKQQCFRAGIAFTEFSLDSDRAYLEARLSEHQVEVG